MLAESARVVRMAHDGFLNYANNILHASGTVKHVYLDIKHLNVQRSKTKKYIVHTYQLPTFSDTKYFSLLSNKKISK